MYWPLWSMSRRCSFVGMYVGGDDELVAMMIACCVRRLSSLGQAHAL